MDGYSSTMQFFCKILWYYKTTIFYEEVAFLFGLKYIIKRLAFDVTFIVMI